METKKYNIYNEDKEYQNTGEYNDAEVQHMINHFGFHAELVDDDGQKFIFQRYFWHVYI